MDVRSGRDCGMHPSDLLLILVTQNAQEIIEWGDAFCRYRAVKCRRSRQKIAVLID